jgi:spore coat protein U-like protein
MFCSEPLVAALFALWVVAGYSIPARAQSCNFSVTDMAFGPVDVIANTQTDTTATVSLNCSSLLPLRVCVNLGAGAGGATHAANRFMVSGSNQSRYSFYSDPAHSNVWGSNLWAGSGANSVSVDFGIGGGSTNLTLYGRVFSGQQTVPAGSYASAFSALDASINYGLLSILLDCSILVTTKTTTFNVTASVPTTCKLSTNYLDFGVAGVLDSIKDGATTLDVTCTNATSYNVGLNGGLSGAGDPTQRKMSKGSEFVVYGLYRDAARTLPFGDAIGVNTVAGSGTGLSQSISVYGRIQPQSTPSAGVYSDTIIVTLTY